MATLFAAATLDQETKARIRRVGMEIETLTAQIGERVLTARRIAEDLGEEDRQSVLAELTALSDGIAKVAVADRVTSVEAEIAAKVEAAALATAEALKVL